MTRRFVSLWFPYWPINIWQRRQNRSPRNVASVADGPLALTCQEGGTRRLYAVNAVAEHMGLRAGMALADAHALIPDLPVDDADPARDLAQLQRLAGWSLRYSPLIALDGIDGLLIDSTGCAHLFGGEAAMAADLLERLQALQIHARLALADTALAAAACARFGRGETETGGIDPDHRFIEIVPRGESETALAGLPVAALALQAADQQSLHRVGLRRISDLLRLPRRALAARFPDRICNRITAQLQRALGSETDLFEPLHPTPDHLVRRVFAEPIARQEDIAAATRDLLQELMAPLERAGRGATRLRLSLYLCDGGQLDFALGLALPSRDVDHMMRLWQERLQGLDAGFGADVLSLAALRTEPLAAHQFNLPATAQLRRPVGVKPVAEVPSSSEASPMDATNATGVEVRPNWQEPALALLVDRLINRLGANHVAHFQAFPSHLPERAYRVLPALAWPRMAPTERAANDDAQTHWGRVPPRPVQLLAPPEPVEVMASVPDGPPLLFRRHGRLHRVRAAEGPERLAPEWWRHIGTPCPPVRDYFRVEDSTGARFWLYRDGLYRDGEADESISEEAIPRWFLHGLFS